MKESEGSSIIPLILTAFAVGVFWIVSLLVVRRFFGGWSDAGVFGDSFGALNALFSGLAFAGIIYTILLQRTELKLQRKKLMETRKQLEASAKAHQELVRLTKAVNIEKIFPSFSIIDFQLDKTTYWFNLLIRDAPLYFVKISRGPLNSHKEFGYGHPEGAKDLKNEGEIIERLQFQSNYISRDDRVLIIRFTDAFGKALYQEMIVEDDRAFLGPTQVDKVVGIANMI